MSTYFKYTRGESFTLSGSDYTGFFSVSGGVAYTGKIISSSSSVLVPNNTFFSACYLQQREFDRVVGSQYSISPENIFAFDILSETELDRVLDALDTNNNIIFSALVTQNPNIFDISLKIPSDRYHFYCLSATELDTRLPDDILTGKTVYTQADPFTTTKWAPLDKSAASFFTVMSDNFTYYTATTAGTISTLLGSFTDPAEIINLGSPAFGLDEHTQYKFVVDDNINKLYAISTTSINVYELPNIAGCGLPNLVDVFSLAISGKSIAYVNNVAIGRSLRGALYYNFTTLVDELIICDKFSNTQKQSILVNREGILNLDSLITFDIRKEDDLLVVLGVRDGLNRLIQLDLITQEIISDKNIAYFMGPEYHYSSISRPLKLECTSFDSNLFFLYNGEWLQTRTLSNPERPASIMTRENMLFLDDYLFDSTEERFNKIQVKFNSNKLKSNYPNILNVCTNVADNRLHMIIHNIGRVYCYKDIDILTQSVPNMDKLYLGGFDCDKNYLGLSLNTRLNSIITDTVNIFNNTSSINKVNIISANQHAVLDIYSSKLLKDIQISVNDFYLHENESVNTASLQRVFLSIYNLQKNIINSINA